ncbi:hypothetical protein LOTGIDRAFT_85054, partial [Lottia gigantea]
RFRPWLTNKIDSCRFPGVEWIDRDLNIFRIPWKHGGKQDWSEQNSLIFKEWAVHTGRFRQGVDKADWPGWKTRFRCAMNKLPDIREIKERSQLDGDEPYRVYQFLNKQHSYTKELLKHLDRGLSIHCKNGDVYATRKCRVVVFFASPESSNPTKIHRNEQSHKIFDYKAFRVALHNYVNGQGPKPSAQVLLGFGQKW